MISSFILISSSFIICITDTAQSNNVFTATIFLEMLRIDIYQYTILSLFNCIKGNISSLEILDIHSEAEIKFQDIFDHIKFLQDRINRIILNENHVGIYDVIKQKFTINILNNDWTISQKKIHFMEEIRRIAYITYDLRIKNDSCNISAFYEYLNKGQDFFKNGEINEANGSQKIFFYFFNNIFDNYKGIFNKVLEKSSNTLLFLGDAFIKKLLDLAIDILIISIIFILIYFIKYYYDYSYYQILFLYYFIITNEQLEFEKQIHYYYKVIHDFDYYSISYFEYIKNNSHLINYNEESNEINNFNNSQNNNNTNINKKHLGDIKKNNKKDGNQNTNVSKKIINGDLNDSLNGSSFLFLNNDKTEDISSKKNIANDKSFLSNSCEKEQKKEEESIDSFFKDLNKIIPNILIIITTF